VNISYPLTTRTPLPKETAALIKGGLTKEVALASLKELAIALLFAGATCFFVSSGQSMAILLGGAVAVVALNTLFRAGAAFCRYERYSELYEGKTPDKGLGGIERILSYLAPASFSVLDLYTRNVLTHECGHVLAGAAFFHSAPTISINPMDGSGLTTYQHFTGYTDLGNTLGPVASGAITSAAGTGLAVLVDLVGLVVAHKIRAKNPQLAKYLVCMAIASIALHIFYALSALWTVPFPGHDFLALAAVGMHPLIGAGIMIALPLIIKGSLCLADFIKEKRQKALSPVTY